MTHKIVMPDLGQTAAEGKIVRWIKNPGDKLVKGEPLLEVETDKVTMEVEAYRSGYLRECLVGEGQVASAFAPIAIVTDDPGEPLEHSGREVAPAAASVDPSPARSHIPSPRAEAVLAAPAAKLLAKELGIHLNVVSGSGPDGLITRRDVERFAAERTAAKATASMAALVTQSTQTIPHFYLSADVDVSGAERWREGWNAAHPDLTATYNDLFVRVASQALRDVPELNVSYRQGRYESRPTPDVLLVVAVERGLVMVPLVDPGSQPWGDYLHSVRKALERAKLGRVTVSSLGSTPLLALSNLGMFKVKQFAAIIPPSCTAILAVGAVRDEALVSGQQVRVGRVATLTLSADHRVVDGVTAAKFMEKIQEHLNTP